MCERELFIVSTNQSDRHVAQNKIETLAALNERGKSKSPASTSSHRRRRDRHDKSTRDVEASPSERLSSSKPKTPRRPHTSSGIREGSNSSNRQSHRTSFSPFSNTTPSPTSQRTPTSCTSAPPPPLKPINTSASTSYVSLNSPNSTHLLPPMLSATADDLVRDWEEELERIASQSSIRSAEMLGFGRRALPSAGRVRGAPIPPLSLPTVPRPVHAS